MRKKLKLSSDGGVCGSKKCKRGYGDTYGGVWRSLHLAEIWSQAVSFVLVRLAVIWLQSHEDLFTLNLSLLYKEIL
jgi:hypothetical protein